MDARFPFGFLYAIIRIIVDAFVFIYRPLPFALLFSMLAMFFLQYAHEHGWAPGEYVSRGVQTWKDAYKKSSLFRSEFFLVFYVMLVLFKALLLRSSWIAPLSDVFGGWGLRDRDGLITFEAIENAVMLVPFSLLLSDVLHKGGRAEGTRSSAWVLRRASLASALFSLCVECLQVTQWLGTFQIADLVYNTVGGIVGAIIYYLASRARSAK